MLNSPVFYQMFTGRFKEAQSDPLQGVPLPDKNVQSVIWMLYFLYHKTSTLNGEPIKILELPVHFHDAIMD